MIARVARRIREEGIARALRRTAAGLRFLLLEFRPSRRRARGLRNRQHEAFDRRHGVDTRGYRLLPNDRFTDPLTYGPVEEAEFCSLMRRLPVDPKKCTFVDFGSGKGKALMLASRFNFQRIVGVEYSAELHAAALRNAARFGSPIPLECVHGDVGTYALPKGELVSFLFNPFRGEVMRSAVENVRRWRENTGGTAWIAYIRPNEARAWHESGFVEVVARDGENLIFVTRK